MAADIRFIMHNKAPECGMAETHDEALLSATEDAVSIAGTFQDCSSADSNTSTAGTDCTWTHTVHW